MDQPLQPARIKVLVAEDHAYSRLGEITHLASYKDFEIVPPGATEREKALQLPNDIRGTLKLVRMHKPDVVVMDIVWGTDDCDGIEAARQIKDEHPQSRVILYSHYGDRKQVVRAVLEGQVDGYVLKTYAGHTLPEAIRTVFRGLPYFVPEVVESLLSIIRAPGSVIPPMGEALKEIELQILQHIARGESNGTIAAQLGYTEAGIKSRINVIYEKLAVYDGVPKGTIDPRITAILKGLQRGYLNLSDLIPTRFSH